MTADLEALDEFGRGLLRLEQGRHALALEHFVVAAEDATGRQERAAALALAAELSLMLGRPYEALEWVDRLRAAADRADQADLLEALARVRLGEPEAALALLDRVEEPTTSHSTYPASSVLALRAQALALADRPGEALDALVTALREDPEDPHVWQELGTLCTRADVDPRVALGAFPEGRFAETVGQLVNAPSAGVDRILEALWTERAGDARALALVTYVGPALPVERALVWSRRMRSAGHAEECPLLGLAANDGRAARERVRAAATAFESFGDERARPLLELAVTALPDADLIPALDEVAALSPALVEPYLVAGAANAARTLRLAVALVERDVPDAALALARHAVAGDLIHPPVPLGALAALADQHGEAELAAALRGLG